MKYLLSVLFVFGVFGGALGQSDRVLDSLKRELSHVYANEDKFRLSEDIAIYYGNHNNLDSAILYAHQSIIYGKKINNKELAGSYRNLAVAYGREGSQLDSCDFYIQLAYEHFLEQKDTINIIESLTTMVSLEEVRGNNEKAMQYIDKALRIIEEIPNKGNELIRLSSSFLYQVGTIHQLQGNYKKSLETHFNGILKINQIQQKSSDIQREYCMHNIGLGNTYISMKKIDSAMIYLKIAKELAMSNKFYRLLSNVYNLIGECHKSEGNRNMAIEFYKKAEIENNKISGNYYSYYKGLVDLLTQEKKFKEALEYQYKYERLFTISENVLENKDLLESKQKIFYSLKKYDSAYHYLSQLYDLKDSIFKMSNAEKTAEIQAKYETEKKEKEIAKQKTQLAEKELEKTQLYFWSGSGILILLSGIGVTLALVIQRTKQRKQEEQKNKELSAANKEIAWLKSNLEHDLGNDLLKIKELGEIDIRNLNTPEQFNYFENLQNILVATIDYYSFIIEMEKNDNKFQKDTDKLLSIISNNILKKYNKQDQIKVLPLRSNLDINKRAEQKVINKAVICIAELIRNTLKYAFPTDFLEKNAIQPLIKIELVEENNVVWIRYEDNGVGLYNNQSKQVEDFNKSGMGFSLLQDIAEKDTFIWENKPKGGFYVQLQLKNKLN